MQKNTLNTIYSKLCANIMSPVPQNTYYTIFLNVMVAILNYYQKRVANLNFGRQCILHAGHNGVRKVEWSVESFQNFSDSFDSS